MWVTVAQAADEVRAWVNIYITHKIIDASLCSNLSQSMLVKEASDIRSSHYQLALSVAVYYYAMCHLVILLLNVDTHL